MAGLRILCHLVRVLHQTAGILGVGLGVLHTGRRSCLSLLINNYKSHKQNKNQQGQHTSNGCHSSQRGSRTGSWKRNMIITRLFLRKYDRIIPAQSHSFFLSFASFFAFYFSLSLSLSLSLAHQVPHSLYSPPPISFFLSWFLSFFLLLFLYRFYLSFFVSIFSPSCFSFVPDSFAVCYFLSFFLFFLSFHHVSLLCSP